MAIVSIIVNFLKFIIIISIVSNHSVKFIASHSQLKAFYSSFDYSSFEYFFH